METQVALGKAEERTVPGFRARDGYVAREIAGEYLLIPVTMQDDREGQIAVLNETGNFLWEQLSEDCTAEDLIRALTAEYEISREQAAEDVQEFLDKLHSYQLLQETGGGK